MRGINKKILFIKVFLVLSISNFIFDFLFRSNNIDILRNVSIAFGIACGVIIFWDPILNKNNE